MCVKLLRPGHDWSEAQPGSPALIESIHELREFLAADPSRSESSGAMDLAAVRLVPAPGWDAESLEPFDCLCGIDLPTTLMEAGYTFQEVWSAGPGQDIVFRINRSASVPSFLADLNPDCEGEMDGSPLPWGWFLLIFGLMGTGVVVWFWGLVRLTGWLGSEK